MTDLKALCTEIDAALKAATPGPWALWNGFSWRRFGSEATGQIVIQALNHPVDHHPDLIFKQADAHLIIKARNEWLTALRAAVVDMEARKDAAYEERNRVVAALARLFPSGVSRTAIPGWSEDWHGCVYIDLPTGQVSWHFHDSQAALFADLPSYDKPWDGHSTEEKYARLARLRAAVAPLLAEEGAELEAAVKAAQAIDPKTVRAPGCTCTDDGRCIPCYRCPECDAAYFAAVAQAVLRAAEGRLPAQIEQDAEDALNAYWEEGYRCGVASEIGDSSSYMIGEWREAATVKVRELLAQRERAAEARGWNAAVEAGAKQADKWAERGRCHPAVASAIRALRREG